jgi:hypothetical protein
LRLALTGRVVAQHVAQLHTGPDAEFGEHGPQVSVDRIRRYAELRGGQPVTAPGADEVRHPPLSISESAHAMRGARRWRAGVLAARRRYPPGSRAGQRSGDRAQRVEARDGLPHPGVSGRDVADSPQGRRVIRQRLSEEQRPWSLAQHVGRLIQDVRVLLEEAAYLQGNAGHGGHAWVAPRAELGDLGRRLREPVVRYSEQDMDRSSVKGSRTSWWLPSFLAASASASNAIR